MTKFCVFCGVKPASKTREHIIPKWLIELTGDQNREGFFGYDMRNNIKERVFSFKSFQFPACKDCNDIFSKLENYTKVIIEKILKNQFLNSYEIDILLDWFDKVRIGLWLGYLYLNKDISVILPKFHIIQRIAQKDRMLAIYEFNDNLKGLNFIGVNTICFEFLPSCFALAINNYVFFNSSCDFLFAKRLGFPYPVESYLLGENKPVFFKITIGSGKIVSPLIRKKIEKSSVEIYQPIIHTEFRDNLEQSPYNCDYVKKNSLDYNEGIGSIFFKRIGNKVYKLKEDKEIVLSGSKKYDRIQSWKMIPKQVLEFQNFLIDTEPSDKLLSVDQINARKSNKKLAKKFNKLLIDKLNKNNFYNVANSV